MVIDIMDTVKTIFVDNKVIEYDEFKEASSIEPGILIYDWGLELLKLLDSDRLAIINKNYIIIMLVPHKNFIKELCPMIESVFSERAKLNGFDIQITRYSVYGKKSGVKIAFLNWPEIL